LRLVPNYKDAVSILEEAKKRKEQAEQERINKQRQADNEVERKYKEQIYI